MGKIRGGTLAAPLTMGPALRSRPLLTAPRPGKIGGALLTSRNDSFLKPRQTIALVRPESFRNPPSLSQPVDGDGFSQQRSGPRRGLQAKFDLGIAWSNHWWFAVFIKEAAGSGCNACSSRNFHRRCGHNPYGSSGFLQGPTIPGWTARGLSISIALLDWAGASGSRIGIGIQSNVTFPQGRRQSWALPTLPFSFQASFPGIGLAIDAAGRKAGGRDS